MASRYAAGRLQTTAPGGLTFKAIGGDNFGCELTIHAFETGSELRTGLTRWIGYYNTDRPHSALAGATPDEAYGKIQAPPYPGLAPDRANPEHKIAA